MSEQEYNKGETGFGNYSLDFGSILDFLEDAAEFITNAPYEAGVDFDTKGNPITPGVHYLPDDIQNLYKERPWVYVPFYDHYNYRNEYEKGSYQPNIQDTYGREIIPRTEQQENNMYDYDDLLERQHERLWGIEHGPNKLGIENYTMSNQHPGFFEDNLYWENMIMPSNTMYEPNESGEMIASEGWSTMPAYYSQPWRHNIKKFDPYDIDRLGPNFTFTEYPDSYGNEIRQNQIKGFDVPISTDSEGKDVYLWDFMNYDMGGILK